MKNSEKNNLFAQTQISNYGRIVQVYEFGARIGSNGKIQKSKHFHLEFLEQGSRVLYPGPGWGIEVNEAAKKELVPTVIELDSKMLRRAKKTFKDSGLINQIECIQGDVLDHKRYNYYDYIVANYFLDVFSKNTMPEVFAHLVSLLKPGGKMFLSGYAPLMGSKLHRLMQWVNHLYANFFCKIIVNNALHDIYDYEAYFKQLGLISDGYHDFKHCDSYGPRFHRVWVATKLDSSNSFNKKYPRSPIFTDA